MSLLQYGTNALHALFLPISLESHRNRNRYTVSIYRINTAFASFYDLNEAFYISKYQTTFYVLLRQCCGTILINEEVSNALNIIF